jgi:hypothetical protein
MSDSDKKQVGLTNRGGEALAVLMKTGLFPNESDAYRVGIAYSLAKPLNMNAAPESGYHTKFNAVGGLDTDGRIRQLIEILRPDLSERPYATAEKLAELGIVELARRVNEHDSIPTILSELSVESESAS